MIGLWLSLLVAQGAGLGPLAETARRAFSSRDFAGLIEERQPVRLELPDGQTSTSVRGRVAAASLRGLLRRTVDRDLAIVGAAQEGGHGYVELRRRFRVLGTQEDQVHRILIAARWDGTLWRVTEVWVARAA